MYQIKQLDACRICESREVRSFLRFEELPFTDGFVSEATSGTEFKAPLVIFWCPICKVAQTLHDVTVTDYYRDYRYSVSTSAFAKRFMQRLAARTFERFGLRHGDRVIEIGSGDGLQLACFQDLGAKVFGFEPSAELTKVSQEFGVPFAQALFSEDTIEKIPAELLPAHVVLLTYTFDHLPDPVGFLNTLTTILDQERGVLLIEVHDLAKIMYRRETCLFEHEHSIYLTAATMKRLLARAGLKLLTLELVPEAERRGNSLLVAAAPMGATYEPDATCLESLEPLEHWEAYRDFGVAVAQSYERFRDYIRSRRASGKRLAGYGAGGRGVMTMAMAGLTSDDLEFVCDQNASFHGLRAPCSHVPVVSAEHLLDHPVDEVIVFSFGYMEEIREQLSHYLARGGTLTSLLDVL